MLYIKLKSIIFFLSEVELGWVGCLCSFSGAFPRPVVLIEGKGVSPKGDLPMSGDIFGCLKLEEKAMATHSSTLAWKILWTEQPGGLQSMGSRRVGDDWVTSLSLFTFMHWRRKWQPTPVFLPGEFQGWRSLVGCHLWGRTELDTTEVT